MKKKLLIAFLCAALAGSMTVQAETSSQPASQETEPTETETSEMETSETETSETETSGSENSGQDGSESPINVSQSENPDVESVITSIGFEPEFTTIYEAQAGQEYILNEPEMKISFTEEWSDVVVVDYDIVTSQSAGRNWSKNDDGTYTVSPAYVLGYFTFNVSRIVIEKDGYQYTFDLESKYFSDDKGGNKFTFLFSPRSDKPSDDDSNDDAQEESGNSDEGREESGSRDDGDNGGDDTADAVVEAPRNVVSAGGASITSSVDGVYSAKAVGGVAVKSPLADVYNSVGAVQDPASKEKLTFYVCDNRDWEEQEIYSQAAQIVGKQLVSVIDMDLYHFTASGCQTVRTSSAPVEIVIALPKWSVDSGKAFSVWCVDPSGQLVQMEDTDTNPETITIQANCFGTYAIVRN